MSPLVAVTMPAELLLRARHRDAVALESIYRTCFPAVRALVRRVVMRPAVADEITQDVFVQVLRHIEGYNGQGTFGAWVRSIAVSRCLMHLRSPWNRAALWLDVDRAGEEGGESAVDPSLATDDGPVRSRNEDTALETALQQLPALSRTVVWLHDVEGYTHAEIALELGRSVSFSKSQLARAHERLRQLLSRSEEKVVCTPASSSY